MFTFIESRHFSRWVVEYLSDEQYLKYQDELIQNPNLGMVVRGSGGVRKLRWPASGRGKRGGYRVIYFVRRSEAVIWMLTIYAKGEIDSIPGHTLKMIRKELESV